jgi:hypothetical protein
MATNPEDPKVTDRSAKAELHEDSFAEAFDSDPLGDEQDAGVWSIAPPTSNTPQPAPPGFASTANNPFANRTAAEILGFMPTAEAAALNQAAEAAICTEEDAPRRHTAVYEEANRPLAEGENLFDPNLDSRRRHNIIAGFVPCDGSEAPPPEVINPEPVPDKEDKALNKWGTKKTTQGRKAEVKRRVNRFNWEKKNGVYLSSIRGRGIQEDSSRAGGGYERKELTIYGALEAGMKDHGGFEDTDKFFDEDEEEDSQVELNPEAKDFTPSAFKPSWRKDEPDGEGGMGAADWVS